MKRITFRAMGCHMAASVDSDQDKAQRMLEQVPGWFTVWEHSLSRFRSDSELSRLNRQAGEWVLVSPLFEEVLQAALAAARQSAGLVTPTVLDALLAAGYDRSFDQLPLDGGAPARGAGLPLLAPTPPPGPDLQGDPAAPATAALLADAATHHPVPLAEAVQHDQSHHRVRLAPGACLDFGGIAKGWAADQAARLLGQAGPALVDAGGDLAASAPKASGDPWAIRVIDPFDPENDLDLALLPHGGIATSGRDYRRWVKDGAPQHHIIDPRTGRPARTDVLSVTVVGPTAQAAELAAKCVLILGSQAGLAWLDQRPELAGLVVLEDGARCPSRGWAAHIWKEA